MMEPAAVVVLRRTASEAEGFARDARTLRAGFATLASIAALTAVIGGLAGGVPEINVGAAVMAGPFAVVAVWMHTRIKVWTDLALQMRLQADDYAKRWGSI